ncbi:MAG: hypothetical protein HONBIEJF_00145 [Fimbriimonadaceae bacterium]|nr:hypothetical protein [Fimbriimonadaceae bacterium]
MPKMRFNCAVRFSAAIGVIAVAAAAWAQKGEQQAFPDPNQMRTDATIVVTQDAMNAQLIEVTVLDGSFPLSTLEAQCQRLGTTLQSMPRGLSIQTLKVREGEPGFPKAKFAVNNLIDATQGLVRLEPLVRAFGTRPGVPQIRVLTVIVEGIRPSPMTLQSWFTPEVSVRGSMSDMARGAPAALEYRIAISAEDPATVTIPDRHTTPPKEAAPVKEPERSPVMMYVIVVIGSVALGALVYSLMLRLGKGKAN